MQLRVDLGDRSYSIHTAPGLLARVGSIAAELGSWDRVVCIADQRVADLHGESVLSSLRDCFRSVTSITFPRGERSKSWATAGRLLRETAQADLGRDGLVVALGGGVTGDLAGFVAATYMRGVDMIQVPTTLLSQVDSSVGGKTGVNLPEGKNLAGVFHQPVLVVADPLSLRTLPKRELRCGLAEALKHGVLDGEEYMGLVESGADAALAGDVETLSRIAVGSCQTKARIVAEDERESGVRATLNLGHTIGHAVEAVGGFRKYRHGEAVSIGLVGACLLSERLNICCANLPARIRGSLSAIGLPTTCAGLDPEALLAAMSRDKKAARGALRWVLPQSVGDVLVTAEVPSDAVLATLRTLSG